MGHARALLALPLAQQPTAATRIVELGMSVRDAERHVHHLLHPAQHAKRKPRSTLDADTLRLENELAETLGANVKLEPGRKGAGRIVIHYSSLEQLDGILARMR
jgi:ParB family chromosome partitioning protein